MTFILSTLKAEIHIPTNLLHKIFPTNINRNILEQKSYISTVENTDLLKVDASITGGIPFLFPGVEASVTGAFEMNPALIPFGIGKRECIGKSLAKIELFLIFSSLMHQFKFMPSSDGKPNLDDVEFSILRIPKPFKVKIENRK